MSGQSQTVITMTDIAQEHLQHPCFYVPGSDTIIDTADLRDGVWRSSIENEDITQIRMRYPNAELADFQRVYEKVEASYRTRPIEITKAQFIYALEVLPPVGWRTARGVESFKISERYYGQMTAIYARVGRRYFTFRDTITLTAEKIADIIGNSNAFKRKPLKFMTLDEFRELNAHFYNPHKAEQYSENDFDLLATRINKLNNHEGPRVGDFVIMPDDNVLRFTHHWPGPDYDELQTTVPGCGDQSFYLSKNGVCDFSGSLADALPATALEDTFENRPGRIWFFHDDYARAHNSVHATIPFRVYRYRPDTQS